MGFFQARILESVAISFSRDRTRVSCIGRWILYCWTREDFVSKLPYNKLDPLIIWSCLPHFFGLSMPSQFGGYFCSFHLPKRLRFQNSKDIIFEMLISSSLGQQEPFQIFYLQKCQNFLYQNTQAIIFEQDFYGTLVAQWVIYHNISTISLTWSRNKEASVASINITLFEA